MSRIIVIAVRELTNPSDSYFQIFFHFRSKHAFGTPVIGRIKLDRVQIESQII